MDRTHDVEPAEPAAQPAPPATAPPGRQPTERGAAAPREGAAPGGPTGGVPVQRFITAITTLIGAMSRFKARTRQAYQPYAAAFETYRAVLQRRAQRQEMVTQMAFQVLFVGLGGAFGGMLSQFVKNHGPLAINNAAAALRRPPPSLAAPPAGSISRREVLGGSAPAPRAAPAPAPGTAPRAPSTDKTMDVAGASTAAGDILKDFIRSLNPNGRGGGAPAGGNEPFEPNALLQYILSSLESVEANAMEVLGVLSAAAETEQITQDPLVAMQEIIAQLDIPPESPQPATYLREFWTRNEWFRTWQAQMMAAPHTQETERLFLHDRRFLNDIEESCPGLVRDVRTRADARITQARRDRDEAMMQRLARR